MLSRRNASTSPSATLAAAPDTGLLSRVDLLVSGFPTELARAFEDSSVVAMSELSKFGNSPYPIIVRAASKLALAAVAEKVGILAN